MSAEQSPERGRAMRGMVRPLVREIGLGLLAFGVYFAVGLLVTPLRNWSSGRFEFLSVAIVFGVSHLLAVCFHYFPRGNDQALARLSLAAFCRTFVPLLAMFSIHNYIFPLLTEANAGSILAAYLISLALTFASALRTGAVAR